MKMSKSLRNVLIITVIIILLSIAIGYIFNSFILSGYKRINVNLKLLLDKNTYIYAVLSFSVFIIIIGLNEPAKIHKRIKGTERIEAGFENARFLSKKEIKKEFTFTSYSKLKNTKSGVVLSSEDKKNEIIMAKAIHAMVIGNTGSGKTQTFVNPNINILSQCKDKPSMIIADPKGELYESTSKMLHERGYELQVIDLISPIKSKRWNPLSYIYDNYQQMVKIKNKKQNAELTKDDFDAIQELNDLVYNDIDNIVKTFFKVPNKNDPMWELGMQSLLKAILLAMLEDSEKKELHMTKDKFNFANLRAVASLTQNNGEELKKYFKDREKSSSTFILSNSVLNSSEKTFQSYATTMGQALNLFSDGGLRTFTSENEVDFSVFDEKPVALFLKIPDERQERYDIASIFYDIAYKELVRKARKNGGTLNKKLYFIIDEFGNLPQIPNLDKMLAVSRSRNIYFILILQSYGQLDKIYSKDVAKIIKDNCNIEVFIGSKEEGTQREFSKKCGNYSVTSISVSQGDKSLSGSTGVKERPLIYPSELAVLNNPPKKMGNSIVIMSGKHPIKTRSTPTYKSRYFYSGKYELPGYKQKFFDEAKNYYDIIKLFNEKDKINNEIPFDNYKKKHFISNENNSPNIKFVITNEEEKLGEKRKILDNSFIRSVIKYKLSTKKELTDMFDTNQYEEIIKITELAIKEANRKADMYAVAMLNKEKNYLKELASEEKSKL